MCISANIITYPYHIICFPKCKKIHCMRNVPIFLTDVLICGAWTQEFWLHEEGMYWCFSHAIRCVLSHSVFSCGRASLSQQSTISSCLPILMLQQPSTLIMVMAWEYYQYTTHSNINVTITFGWLNCDISTFNYICIAKLRMSDSHQHLFKKRLS